MSYFATMLSFSSTGELLSTLDTHQMSHNHAAVSPCGRFVASCGKFTLGQSCWISIPRGAEGKKSHLFEQRTKDCIKSHYIISRLPNLMALTVCISNSCMTVLIFCEDQTSNFLRTEFGPRFNH